MKRSFTCSACQLRLARKQHQCILCGRVITQGEFYVWNSLTPWDNHTNTGFINYKAHYSCDIHFYNNYKDSDYLLPDCTDTFYTYLPKLKCDDFRAPIFQGLYEEMRSLRPHWPIARCVVPLSEPVLAVYRTRQATTPIVVQMAENVLQVWDCTLKLLDVELVRPDSLDSVLELLVSP